MLKTLSRLIHQLVLHLGLHRCHLVIRVSWHAYGGLCFFLWFPPRPPSASLTSNMGETWQPSQFRSGQKILTWGFITPRRECSAFTAGGRSVGGRRGWGFLWSQQWGKKKQYQKLAGAKYITTVTCRPQLHPADFWTTDCTLRDCSTAILHANYRCSNRFKTDLMVTGQLALHFLPFMYEFLSEGQLKEENHTFSKWFIYRICLCAVQTDY